MKGAIKDVGRALGMTPEQRNQILKDIDLTTPEGFNALHDKVID